MNIRTYQPGDEDAQAAIYNAAGAALPKFKPATAHEITRRTRARDFDPATKLYAEEGGRVVGYCSFHPNGRVSYPWCQAGAEARREPLFAAALDAMRGRGIATAFAAYRADWPAVNDFFTAHGFALAREMVNFVVDFNDMPTPSARMSSGVSPLTPADVPAVLALAPEVLRVRTPEALHAHLFKNPYFPPEALFALRSRADNAPVAVGIVIDEPSYADPLAVDSAMPCFRLGAFGTEGMQVKRLRGVFSFLARLDKSLFSLGMDLLAYATYRLSPDDDLGCFAAQVPSDAPMLLGFYQRTFRRQGSFPVFERDLSAP